MQRDLGRGFRDSLPVALSAMAGGGVLGVLAAQKGVTLAELLVMDLLVFAGSAQFVMVEMWHHPLPIVEMTLAVLIINLRYGLIGASLRGLFEGRSTLQRVLTMHLVADENWAMTMAASNKRVVTPWHLLGGGLCVLSFWLIGTLLGRQLGALIPDPAALALDFAFVAVFAALAMGFWRGKADLLPWGAAAGLAILAEMLLPGKWYILIGSLGGALVATLLPPRSEALPTAVGPTAADPTAAEPTAEVAP